MARKGRGGEYIVIAILVGLIVIAILAYAVYTVLNMLPIPQPIKTLIYLLVALIILVWVLDTAGIYHFPL